jgi:Flp pilus assembly protein TadD
MLVTGVAHSQSPLHPAVRRMVVAGLLLLTALAYTPGLHGEFQLDDWRTVESNLGIRVLGDYMSPRVWLAALQSARALTDFSFALNYAVGGLDPFFYHVGNLAIHLVVVVLVYVLAREILGLAGLSNRAGLVLAVTALFALHPLQSQAVVYVSQRAEELAAGLYLGALLLLLGAERRGVTWAGVWLYLAALAAFVLSLASKSGGLTLPFAYLLLGILPERASYSTRLARPRRRLALAVPFASYAALVVTMTLPGLKSAAPGLATAGFEVPRLSAWHYFLTQWHVIATYLRLLLWPAGQNLDWDFPLAGGLGDPAVISGGLALSGLLAGALYLLHRCRYRDDGAGGAGRVAAFGVLWFFLVIAPSSSIVPLADVLMEHRLYLPSFGIFLTLVVGTGPLAGALAAPRAQRVVMVLLLLICAGLATLTFRRVSLWRSKIALWSDVVAKSPGKARAHLGLGNSYRRAGQTQLALDQLLTARDLARADPVWLRADIQERLASIHLAAGRSEEALAAARAGLAEWPDHSALLGIVAMAHLQRRELALAEAAAQRSVATSTQPATALVVLGMVRARMDNPQGATAAFEQAVRRDPALAQARLLLAQAYRAQGRTQQACEVLRGSSGGDSLAPAFLQEARAADCPER